MSSDSEELVQMANQIADFFRAYPPEEAVEGVAEHIRDFWDPRMRRQLASALRAGAPGLDDLARAGALRACPEAAPATKA